MTKRPWPANFDHCPNCNRKAPLSTKGNSSTNFTEPLCKACREAFMNEEPMSSFDHAYAHAIANGWSD